MRFHSALLVVTLIPCVLTRHDTDKSSNSYMFICNERLEMHLGVQVTGVRSVKIFRNDTLLGSLEELNGNWSTGNWSTEYKEKIDVGTEGGIVVSLYNVSSSDAGTYKCSITYNSGAYTNIVWQLSFQEKMNRSMAFNIILQSKKTTPESCSRPGLIKDPIQAHYSCKQVKVECFLMEETFICRQHELPSSVCTESNIYLYCFIGASVVIVILVVLVITVLIYTCVKKRNRRSAKYRRNRDRRDRDDAPFMRDIDRHGSVRMVPNPRRMQPPDVNSATD